MHLLIWILNFFPFLGKNAGSLPQYYFISGSGSKQHFTKKNLKLISKSLNEEQKKYNIKLSGGDTVNANKVSFSITTIGFSKYIRRLVRLQCYAVLWCYQEEDFPRRRFHWRCLRRHDRGWL